MSTAHLEKKFSEMGARIRVSHASPSQRVRGPYALDVKHDKRGEFFDLQLASNTDEDDFQVIGVDPKDRHLLLKVISANKELYLCGHDERHWFAAGVHKRSVTNVRDAKAALRPEVVDVNRLRVKDRDKRRNEAYIRQGEWFFTPEPGKKISDKFILYNEPLRRGRNKPHMCEQLYREGGENVYVCRQYPNGCTQEEYAAILKSDSEAKHYRWAQMRRNPRAYVRGKVRHPDHKAIVLGCWHRVVPNTEDRVSGVARERLTFLD